MRLPKKLAIFGHMLNIQEIFAIATQAEFESVLLKVFRYQFKNNSIYRKFCTHLNRIEATVNSPKDIPFLPIEFFKSKKIISRKSDSEIIFMSSGTTGSTPSKHYVADIEIYRHSFLKGFEHFYGSVSQYCILALLPSYLEREGSSLIYMVDDLIEKSGHPESGFYMHDTDALNETLQRLDANGTKVLLIGVSFALLDLVEKYRFNLKNTTIMETGGMKGRRKEMIREELHDILKNGFGVKHIHSEYGMTELLSQAYSQGNGIFDTPPWMQVMPRDIEDPLTFQSAGKTGGLNIIDLANIRSCSFIATQDLGRVSEDGTFEVLGRFDHSDIRGCNLIAL